MIRRLERAEDDLLRFALSLPFVTPTGYGLAKSGWVTATFTARDKPPVEVPKQ